MTLSVYLKRKILKHVFHGEAYTPPTISVALTNEFGVEATGVGTGYARVETAADVWSDAVDGGIHNDLAVTFPEAEIDWPLGTPRNFVLYDSEVWGAGNQLATGSLTVYNPVLKGFRPSFSAGKLRVTLDGAATGLLLGTLPGSDPPNTKLVGRGIFSDYVENKMMDHIFGYGNRNWPPPDNFAGLLTAYPDDTAVNDSCNEVLWSHASYLRARIFPSEWSFPTIPGADDIYNIELITFPEALEHWGEVVAVALFDVSSPVVDGNLLLYSPCPMVDVLIGSVPRFDLFEAGESWPGIDCFFDTEVEQA